MNFVKEDFNTTLLALFLEEDLHLKPKGKVRVYEYVDEELTLDIDEGTSFWVSASRYFEWLQKKAERELKQ